MKKTITFVVVHANREISKHNFYKNIGKLNFLGWFWVSVNTFFFSKKGV